MNKTFTCACGTGINAHCMIHYPFKKNNEHSQYCAFNFSGALLCCVCGTVKDERIFK